MAIKLVSISEIIGKHLYASPGHNVNIRSGTNPGSKLLATIKGGDLIGEVSTYAQGTDAKGNKDGSIWLQLTDTYSNPSGYGAWVKHMPNIFDWSALKQQGAQTVEEVKAAEEEANKSGFDKILESLQGAGKWILIGWVAINVLNSKQKK